MVIKNKDGSEYKLRGPNPIMKTQNLWEHFEIHNMDFQEVIDHFKKNHNKTTILNFNKDEIVIEDKNIKTEELNTNNENKEIDLNQNNTFVENKEQELPDTKSDKKTSNQENNPEVDKVIIHCLPANITVKHDNLYGDVKKLIKYGEKFTFDAVLLESEDFQIAFWTNLKLTNESIIYPKNSDKRWWKIKNSEPKFNGFVYYGSPSNTTPNFED